MLLGSLTIWIGWMSRAKESSQRSELAKMAEYDYDLFTIGAGSGGVRASRWAATQYGVKVAVAELPFDFVSTDETKGGAGGTCVIRGCVPKKLLIYGGHFSEEFGDSRGYGWQVGKTPEINWEHLIQVKNKEIQRLNGVYKSILKNANVELIEGRAKITGPHSVSNLVSGGCI